jgi:hypothetical protein
LKQQQRPAFFKIKAKGKAKGDPLRPSHIIQGKPEADEDHPSGDGYVGPQPHVEAQVIATDDSKPAKTLPA